MAVKSRRDEYADLTRAAIVEAAISRFGADGFASTTVDDVAEAARVTKGGVYHHFKDKSALFEAAFIAMEERLIAKLAAGAAGVTDAWEAMSVGVEVFLAECSEPAFRRIVLEDAPAALGWVRWKEIEDAYFLGLVKASLDALASTGEIELPEGDLPARMLLAALGEAGLSVASSGRDADREAAAALVMRVLSGFKPAAPPEQAAR